MKKIIIISLLAFTPIITFAQASGGQITRESKKTVRKSSVVKRQEIKYSYSTPIGVDLGLPSGTLWADRNVGANTPEDRGYDFVWGETIPRERNKQNIENSSLGDSKGTKQKMNLKDDAAYVNLGHSWVLPTYEQIKELTNQNYTEIYWVIHDGIGGLKIISRKNGNSIFVPTSGKSFAPNIGYYWTSDVNEEDNREAYSLVFDRDGVSKYHNTGMKYQGRQIRPVYYH